MSSIIYNGKIMRIQFTLIFIICTVVYLSAQLVNNNGTLNVEAGSTLVVESNIINSGTGIINNNSVIEVQGNITSENTATFTSGVKLAFTGSGTSIANFGSGTTLFDVDMSMTGGGLILNSDMVIDGDLTFTTNNNRIFLGDYDLTLSTSSTADVTGVSNSFVVTDGTGSFTKEGLTSFTFPVGGTTDTQNDITLTESGTVDDISVRVLAEAYDDPTVPSGAKTSGVVAATWEITEGTTGGSDLTAVTTWEADDETTDFDNSMSAIHQYDGTDYTALQATAPASFSGGVYSITNAGLVLDGTDYLIIGDDALSTALLAIKMFLEGPYETSASLMRDDLRTGTHLPLIEPYGTMTNFTHVGDGGTEAVSDQSDFNYPTDADDVVDWVFMEIRDNSNAAISTRSALLQRDGDIVDLDGGPVRFTTVADGSYDVVVRHRNHLGVKSATNITVTKGSITIYDFTTAASQTQGADVPDLGSDVYGAYSADANSDGQVNAVDKASEWRVQNGGAFTYTASTADFNMDGAVNSVDLTNYWRINNSKTTSVND